MNYILPDENWFNWREKTVETFKPLKLYQITLELEIWGIDACDAQFHLIEMVDNFLDYRAKLSQVTKVLEVHIDTKKDREAGNKSEGSENAPFSDLDAHHSLKQHLEDVERLKGKSGLSPFSKAVLKHVKDIALEIDEYGGSVTETEDWMDAFLELINSVKVNCTADEVEVIELANEAIWCFTDLTNRDAMSDYQYLLSDKVIQVWENVEVSD